jgi:ribonuclease P protein component
VATEETTQTTQAWIHAPYVVSRRAESDQLSSLQGTTQVGSLAVGSTNERRISQTLSREQRLRRKSDFQMLREVGISRAHPLLILRATPNNLSHTRFGFVVGKRVSLKAVERNLIRRRLREVVRRVPIQGGWDQLLIARRSIVSAEFSALRDAVLQLEKRLGLLVKAEDSSE